MKMYSCSTYILFFCLLFFHVSHGNELDTNDGATYKPYFDLIDTSDIIAPYRPKPVHHKELPVDHTSYVIGNDLRRRRNLRQTGKNHWIGYKQMLALMDKKNHHILTKNHFIKKKHNHKSSKHKEHVLHWKGHHQPLVKGTTSNHHSNVSAYTPMHINSEVEIKHHSNVDNTSVTADMSSDSLDSVSLEDPYTPENVFSFNWDHPPTEEQHEMVAAFNKARRKKVIREREERESHYKSHYKIPKDIKATLRNGKYFGRNLLAINEESSYSNLNEQNDLPTFTVVDGKAVPMKPKPKREEPANEYLTEEYLPNGVQSISDVEIEEHEEDKIDEEIKDFQDKKKKRNEKKSYFIQIYGIKFYLWTIVLISGLFILLVIIVGWKIYENYKKSQNRKQLMAQFFGEIKPQTHGESNQIGRAHV